MPAARSRPKPLNDRQLALLRRICAEHEPVTSAESSLAPTVYALRRRGLVTTAWHDGRWTAHPTAAGHERLRTGHDPQPAAHGDTNPNPNPQLPTDLTTPAELAAHLLAQLHQTGDTLHFTNPPPDHRAALRRALHAAKARHLVPEGHHLTFTGRDNGDFTLHLRPGTHPVQTATHHEPVHVDPDLSDPDLHPTARSAPLPVCPDCQPRARRIIHALVHAAQHHGLTATAAEPEGKASIELTNGESTYSLLFSESHTEQPDPSSVQYSWQRVTAHTLRPSHALDLSLPHDWGNQGRRYRWGDRQRWRLEDKLPHILDEIAQRARHAEDKRRARQREEEETHHRWCEAKDQARNDLIHAHRLKILHEQADAWHEARRIRAYCDALEQNTINDPSDHPEENQAVIEWITWARDHAARRDPLPQRPSLPDPPEITPEDLRPYLRGWSPHEPQRR